MPCYCSLIRAYERDIAKLEKAYRINKSMDAINDSLEAKVQLIKSMECAAYEANNIEEIEEAVDRLDDNLRVTRDLLGNALMSKINEAQHKQAEYIRKDRDHHERERMRRAMEQSQEGGA